MHTRLIPFVRAAATLAVVAGTMFASAASAQVCPYNSTQGTCACPTSGAGTTCFGGQLFRSSDNSCQSDARPCAANQNWNCSTTSCVCNTASYPCGGCTAASSTVGATCTAPAGGQYTNVCGACSCPAGKTLCSSSNTCVLNRACPAGTTWDPCTDTCGTPNVLLSPGWVQSGFIQVNGDVKSTAGNIRMDSATAAGQGDIYVANGKALRVDGAGATNLNIGNWGVGGSGFSARNFGSFFVDGNVGIGTTNAPSQLTVGTGQQFQVNSAGLVSTSNDSVANAFRTYASGSAGSPAYTWNGDTNMGMYRIGTDVLGITTAGVERVRIDDTGRVGVGTTLPNAYMHVNGSGRQLTLSGTTGGVEMLMSRPSTSFPSQIVLQTGANNDWIVGEHYTDSRFGFKPITTQPNIGPMVLLIDPAGRVGINMESPTEALDVFGKVKALSLQITTGAGAGRYLVSDASGNATWQVSSSVTGSGSVDRIPKFTATSAVGDSNIYTSATDVSINTPATEGYALNVQTKATNFGDGIQIHHASQGQKWQLAVLGTGTTSPGSLSIQNNPTGGNRLAITSTGNVGVGTLTPDQKFVVKGGGIGFDNNSSDKKLYSPADGTLEWMTHNSAPEHGFAISHQGTKAVYLNTSGNSYLNGGNVGIGTASPANKLDVSGDFRATGKLRIGPADGSLSSHAAVINNGSGDSTLTLYNNGGYNRLYFWNGSTYQGGIIADHPTTSTPNAIMLFTATSAPLQLGTAGNERARITPSGSFGIGTTAPAQKFQVSGGGAYGLGVACGDAQCLHFRNNGWIYTGDTAGNVYGGVGLAADKLWAENNLYVGGSINATSGSDIQFHTDRADDANYEWLGYYSGGTRQGIMIYDGNWDGCASDYEFCIKAENGNNLNLKADGGTVNVLNTLTAYGTYYGSYTGNSVYGSALYGAYYDYGLYASGTGMGGYFYDSNNYTSTYISYGNYSVFGYGWLRGAADNGYTIYIGGDSAGGDIEIGSQSNTLSLALWNSYLGARMNVYGGTYYNYSSIRYKENVETIPAASETLSKLRGVNFDWKLDAPTGDRGKRDVGVIAEEVEKVFPIAVQYDEDGKAANVAYTKFIPLLIQAANEQQAEIDGLRARLEALEKRLGE